MSKKVVNILLIVFCITIYGAIFFKAFGKKETKNESFVNVVNYNSSHIINNPSKDSFVLTYPDRNPFGTASRLKDNRSIKNTKIKQSNNKKKKQIIKSWPSITYYGFVKNKLNREKLVALKINNRFYKVREKDTIAKIEIKKILNDSIVVVFNEEEKTIKKQ